MRESTTATLNGRPLIELHIEPARMPDGLTPAVAVGIVGCRQCAELKGIQRVGRVDMQVAEVGVAFTR